MFSDLKFRMRALLRRAAVERELDDELRFHLEREIEKNVRGGMSRVDAERAARLAFGGVERIKDDARDARGISFWDTLSQDLRYAWRGLRRRPGFALAVVTTLALGIGANAAMFGIVDRVLFRPPPHLVDMERTHRVFLHWRTPDNTGRADRHVSYLRYLELRGATRSFDRMALFADREIAVGTGLEARDRRVAAVSASFFEFFDARPVIGRFFTPAEDTTPAGAMVAVLGHAQWQSRYGGQPGVIGEKLHIGSQIYTIIGVAPPSFAGLGEDGVPVAFVPITSFASARGDRYFQNHNWSWAQVIAHRRAGVSFETATADLTNAWVVSWDREMASSGGQSTRTAADVGARAELASVLLGRGPDADATARVAAWVMGVAIIVLLIACANVANLLLARALARRREITLRLALGVTRRRLYQQLLTESALIAVGGGIVGLALGHFGGRLLQTFFLASDASMKLTDGRTLAFTTVVTLLVALFTGLAPALHALRGDLAGALKSGAREGTYRRSRTRSALLVAQGAMSVVLLVGAGLFVRSLDNVRDLRIGYDVDPVVLVQGVPRGARLSKDASNALLDRLVADLQRMPGVRSVTRSASVPFYSFEGRGAPRVPGRDSLHKLGSFLLQIGDAAYFETMGTRILRGRGIASTDRRDAPLVVVVSDAMARAIWPGEDAIGRQFRLPDRDNDVLTIVGIAEDIRAGQLQGNAEMWYYLPADQYGVLFDEPLSLQILARVQGRADDHLEPIRRGLMPAMPGEGYVTTIPMRSLLAEQQRSWEFGATMFLAFGALALTLAAIGLYSVIAYAVRQRSHELGVRIALGASVRNVVTMVVRQGMGFAVTGVVIGLVVALWAGRWVEPLLFQQSARDPVIVGSAAVVLLLVALFATLRPAIRATRVDPTEALRAD
jgi:putative ABC transport system permease protein